MWLWIRDECVEVEIVRGRVRFAHGAKPIACDACGHNPVTGQVTGDEKAAPSPRATDGAFPCAHCGKSHTIDA
jgi:predicted RNA-binding Zn-ribbon protein involved in translation (DUF1610 family)